MANSCSNKKQIATAAPPRFSLNTTGSCWVLNDFDCSAYFDRALEQRSDQPKVVQPLALCEVNTGFAVEYLSECSICEGEWPISLVHQSLYITSSCKRPVHYKLNILFSAVHLRKCVLFVTQEILFPLVQRVSAVGKKWWKVWRPMELPNHVDKRWLLKDQKWGGEGRQCWFLAWCSIVDVEGITCNQWMCDEGLRCFDSFGNCFSTLSSFPIQNVFMHTVSIIQILSWGKKTTGQFRFGSNDLLIF